MRLHSTERLPNCKRLSTATRVLRGGFVLLFFVGCATPPPPAPEVTPQERIQRDQVIGAGVARQFEAQRSFKQDKEVLVYLHSLAVKLAEGTPELKTSAIGVLITVDRGARWNDYSIPGNRIYISSGLLKQVGYENELAAAIAIEFAHIIRRHVPQRLLGASGSKPGLTPGGSPTDFPSIEGLIASSSNGAGKAIDFFSPTGVYAYPDEYCLEAAEDAVEILYRAGFDPRGLVSLWSLYRAKPVHSPYEDDILRKLTEKTRTVIAGHSPLRNPIVRSQAFITIQRRMQRL